MFSLSPRLYCCAKMVKYNSKIVDVGTDHAYLPIWLSKNNIISRAIACDVNKMPLERAKKNIEAYEVKNVETRISDGLSNIDEFEVDTVIIAGMGGELIYKIISECKWAKSKTLILQPMSSGMDLRFLLTESGYKIDKEVAIKAGGKVYTVMKVAYSGEKVNYDGCYFFIGNLLDDKNTVNEDTLEYVHKQIRDIVKRKKGEEFRQNYAKVDYYDKIICKIKNALLKYDYLE